MISELEAAILRNPARGQPSEGLPGAWRLQVSAIWAWAGETTPESFYTVYYVEDGVLRLKEAPPAMDSFNQAIARYDRDSIGGCYVVEGLNLVYTGDNEVGSQTHSLSEGRAQVNGYKLELPVSRSVVNAQGPDLREIEVADATSQAQTAGGQRVKFAHAPVKEILSCRLTVEETFTLVHGGFQGCADDLPVTGVLTRVVVKQGSTAYAVNASWVKNGDQIDWSQGGVEPANGSTYTAKVRYFKDFAPLNVDLDGFTVKEAVAGTQIIYAYRQMLPRYDRLLLNADGSTSWKICVAAKKNPILSQIPDVALLLSSVYQNWRLGGKQISNDSPRLAPFERVAAIEERQDYMLQEIARNRLEIFSANREFGMRVGIFVDPLFDVSMRDQGLIQTGAVFDDELTLPMTGVGVANPDKDIRKQEMRSFGLKTWLEQLLVTGDFQVNPYLAFEPFPAQVVLNPPVDQWTGTKMEWTSAETQYVTTDAGRYVFSQTVSVSASKIAYLRQIDLVFDIYGFEAGEILQRVVFDVRDVISSVLAA